MFKGGIRVFTGMVVRRNARKFKIGTPTAVVGVRGTGFDLLFRGKPGTEEQALLPNKGLLQRLLDSRLPRPPHRPGGRAGHRIIEGLNHVRLPVRTWTRRRIR